MPKTKAEYRKSQHGISELSQKLSFWIKVIGSGIAISVGYLELRDAPLDKITEVFSEDSVLKFGLFLFFVGWSFGATHDTDIQVKAYYRDPNHGIIGLKEYAGIAVFFPVFGCLFWFHDQPIIFQLLLIIFLLVNMVTFSVVIMGRAKDIIEKSVEEYSSPKDYAKYMKLYCAVEYLTGNWQKKRFIWLLIFAILQLIVVLYLFYNEVPAALANYSVNGVKGAQIAEYLPSVLFLVYVLISEAWMKIYRYKVFSDFETIDAITDHFRMSKLAEEELPPINYKNLFLRGKSDALNYR